MSIKKFEEFNFFNSKKENNTFISDWKDRIIPLNTKEYVEKYANGEIHLSHNMNVLMNNRKGKVDYYEVLGKYMFDMLKEKNKTCRTLMSIENGKLKDYRHLFVFFITDDLNDKFLKQFGNRYAHSHWGEGDEERLSVDALEAGIDHGDHLCASHFFTINGNLCHIEYDHRGTSVQLDPTVDVEDLCEDMKALICAYIDYL
jgi:hypothetical protein